MTLNKINPAYRNLNSTNQSLGTPLLASDVNLIIDGVVLFSKTGNWALPVTQGTLNSFVVSIYIYGDTI